MIKVFSRCLLASTLLATSFMFASQSAVAQQCPAINCDCSSIEGEKWRLACQRHESRIKKSCVANGNTPKDYCSIHGLAAKPLPLSIEFSEIPSGEKASTKALEDKKDSLYWLIGSDTDAAKESFKAGNYSRTLQILKLIESNINGLFVEQRKLDSALIAAGDQGRAESMWRKSGGETKKYADTLLEFGADIAKGIATAPQQKQKKIYEVLSKKTIRLAGLGFEHAGYAYGRAERQGAAAKAWGLAANAAEQLIAIDKSLGVKKSDMKFNELQAAARMHRMSYHYMLDEELEDAANALKSSQAFMNREEQQYIGDLVNALESTDEEEGVLSGR